MLCFTTDVEPRGWKCFDLQYFLGRVAEHAWFYMVLVACSICLQVRTCLLNVVMCRGMCLLSVAPLIRGFS